MSSLTGSRREGYGCRNNKTLVPKMSLPALWATEIVGSRGCQVGHLATGVLLPQHTSLFPPDFSQQYSLSNQGLHVSEP